MALKLNAVIFQVRPACDALYQSNLEPWSEYLTGVQGRAPSSHFTIRWPLPLPKRTGADWNCTRGSIPFARIIPRPCRRSRPIHISQTHPDLVRSYGNFLWLDPGEPAVREYTVHVVMDVVRRYDVDGVHFDDYFYPYPKRILPGWTWIFPIKQAGKNTARAADWRAMTGGGPT